MLDFFLLCHLIIEITVFAYFERNPPANLSYNYTVIVNA